MPSLHLDKRAHPACPQAQPASPIAQVLPTASGALATGPASALSQGGAPLSSPSPGSPGTNCGVPFPSDLPSWRVTPCAVALAQ